MFVAYSIVFSHNQSRNNWHLWLKAETCWKHHRLSDHQILWFLPYVVRQVRICYIHVYLLLVVVTSLLGIDWPVLTCVLQASSGLSDVPFQNGHELKVYPILAGGSEHFLFIYIYIGNSNPNSPIFSRGVGQPPASISVSRPCGSLLGRWGNCTFRNGSSMDGSCDRLAMGSSMVGVANLWLGGWLVSKVELVAYMFEYTICSTGNIRAAIGSSITFI